MGPCACLLTQTEGLDDGTIAVDIAFLQVVKQCTTFADETCECTLGAVVLEVLLHVLGQVSDTETEECNLTLGATRVGGTSAELFEELGLLSGI